MVASNALLASTWASRTIGLLGRETLPEEEALVFPGCHSIHTVGMRFPIDVMFVDRGWRVVALREALPPGRVLWPVWGAWGVVEMAQGSLSKLGLAVGDELSLDKND